jgi:hypothetical protein
VERLQFGGITLNANREIGNAKMAGMISFSRREQW